LVFAHQIMDMDNRIDHIAVAFLPLHTKVIRDQSLRK